MPEVEKLAVVLTDHDVKLVVLQVFQLDAMANLLGRVTGPTIHLLHVWLLIGVLLLEGHLRRERGSQTLSTWLGAGDVHGHR